MQGVYFNISSVPIQKIIPGVKITNHIILNFEIQCTFNQSGTKKSFYLILNYSDEMSHSFKSLKNIKYFKKENQ